MKKLSFVLVAALAMTFTACDAKKNQDNTSSQDSTQTVATPATETAATPVSNDEVLGKYEGLVAEIMPLIEKMKKGDISATQKYAQLTQELSKFVQDNQALIDKFTPEQAKKYTDLAKKLLDATTK